MNLAGEHASGALHSEHRPAVFRGQSAVCQASPDCLTKVWHQHPTCLATKAVSSSASAPDCTLCIHCRHCFWTMVSRLCPQNMMLAYVRTYSVRTYSMRIGLGLGLHWRCLMSRACRAGVHVRHDQVLLASSAFWPDMQLHCSIHQNKKEYAEHAHLVCSHIQAQPVDTLTRRRLHTGPSCTLTCAGLCGAG